jgi:hypothetical protein
MSGQPSTGRSFGDGFRVSSGSSSPLSFFPPWHRTMMILEGVRSSCRRAYSADLRLAPWAVRR